MRKPDQEAFENLLKENKLVPGETLFIDDGEENVEAAKKLGMHTLLYGSETLKTIFDIPEKIKEIEKQSSSSNKLLI